MVDKISLGFVKGATVDYVEELIRSAFQVCHCNLSGVHALLFGKDRFNSLCSLYAKSAQPHSAHHTYMGGWVYKVVEPTHPNPCCAHLVYKMRCIRVSLIVQGH